MHSANFFPGKAQIFTNAAMLALRHSTPYRISFYPGTSGRFVGSMINALLYNDPRTPYYSKYNSAHSFHKSFDKCILMSHGYPTIKDPVLQEIVILFGPHNFNEVAVNILYKNHIDTLKDYNFAELKTGPHNFSKLHFEYTNTEYTGQELTQDVIVQLAQGLVTRIKNDTTHNRAAEFTFREYNPKTLCILFSDIFESTGSSWVALEQICEFTKLPIKPNVLEGWNNYVACRNNLIDNELSWLYNKL
jgi:hypothetical protein